MRFRTSLALVALAFVSSAAASAQQPAAGAKSVRTVAILIYPGVELLDFAGPGEVFSAARAANGSGFRVVTVAETAAPIVSQRFVTITPEFTLETCPKPDIVVFPGGNVPDDSAAIQTWIKRIAPETEVLMSVCNGAFLLAKAGLLDGADATTHWGSLDSLALTYPKVRVLADRRFVDNGKIVTTAGVSAGIDGALHVVARLLGRESAERTARYMEYRWEPDKIAADHTRPATPIVESPGHAFFHFVCTSSVQDSLARYAALRAELPAEKFPDEAQLNNLGYAALSGERAEDALKLFAFITAAYPESWNAHDSLGEALLSDGQHDAAIAAYRRSLELNAENQNAVRMLHRAATDGRLQPRARGAARNLIRDYARAAEAVITPRDEPGTPLTVSGVVRGPALRLSYRRHRPLHTGRRRQPEPAALRLPADRAGWEVRIQDDPPGRLSPRRRAAAHPLRGDRGRLPRMCHRAHVRR